METISRWLLTFLGNSLWQIPLIAAAAALTCRLLRKSPAAHWHAVWASAMVLAVVLPMISVRRAEPQDEVQIPVSMAVPAEGANPSASHAVLAGKAADSRAQVRPTVWLEETTAAIVLGAYLLFVLYRIVRLVWAATFTLRLRRAALDRTIPAPLKRVAERCQEAFGVNGVKLLFSPKISGPVTAGGAVILPESLVAENSENVLTTAIGHEMAHVARRDFGCNLVYELLYMPVSFHPAAWLIRRRIERTREMACDEMVTEQLLDRQVYARSIVSIATAMSALPSPGYTLGVFDGDILEARIRRLAERPAANLKRARLLLVGGLVSLVVCAVVASSLSFTARAQGAASDMILQGQAAYNRGDYKTAANDFDAAVRIEPDNLPAKLMLAKSLMQPLPAGMDPSNPVIAIVRKQYLDVLVRDPRNQKALHGMMIVSADCKQYPEAYEWAQKAIEADASDAAAYYTSGVADWTMAFPDYMKARREAGMQPQDPGIIPDAGLRAQFRTQHMSQLQDGVEKLEMALQIKPDYSAAFAYMNLLYRIEAGVADDAGASAELTAKADGFVKQALDAQKKQAQSGTPADQADGMLAVPAPPPPPPPPPPAGFGGAAMVQVRGSEQQSRLVKEVAPVGPAGVSGTVRFSEVIGKDGRVRNLQVLSGPPALVQAAMEAVRQWEYQPLLVNGTAMEVSTTVEVDFPGK